MDVLNIKFKRNPWRTRLLSLDSHKGSRQQADIRGRLTTKAKFILPFLWVMGEGAGGGRRAREPWEYV